MVANPYVTDNLQLLMAAQMECNAQAAMERDAHLKRVEQATKDAQAAHQETMAAAQSFSDSKFLFNPNAAARAREAKLQETLAQEIWVPCEDVLDTASPQVVEIIPPPLISEPMATRSRSLSVGPPPPPVPPDDW